jgi:glutamine phosphoribosylpyrophosphate amidotransferase
MCGICGIMLENYCYNDFPIGSILYKMMESQQIRAQDSTGIAIFNKEFDHKFYKVEYFKKENDKYNKFCENVSPDRLNAVLYDLNQDPNVIISTCGKQMSLIKDIGLVRDLDIKYGIKSIQGTHGIGHLRIATSSRVTPYNAHPFNTTIMPDMAVVHNGEIANYSKLRSSLELQGYRFYSTCDSEVITVFIADQLLKHNDIERANYEFINKADGPFTYIVSTPNCLALVRDRFGARKGIFGYNPGTRDYPSFWAIATDLSALDCVGANLYVETPQPGKPKIFYKNNIQKKCTF